ncbi:DUF6351 family protein [Variovorax sp. OV329]|uniref:DUF6351 family protein n=1 Tax=Variovorax sp. OV329 TaxID=1882825 RepID=UPI0008EF2EA2|nr:DUF6351 family protein [Variovorax sp. OV329]SFL87976.1 hypothetical protein SAMN05444747_101103 [Variovorax sp. OV329]
MTFRTSRTQRRAYWATMLAAATAVAVIGGCGGGGSASPAASSASPPASPPASAAFNLKVLSSDPQYVSGGDALVEVTLPQGIDVAFSRVQLALNGKDLDLPLVASADDPRKANVLVSGLTQNTPSPPSEGKAVEGSANVLQVRNLDLPAQKSQLTLTNFPITGPILSGPQIWPYDCLTAESGLGAPVDAFCSANTRVDWYYRTQDVGTTPGSFKSYAPGQPSPADMATATTAAGATVPFIVRVESGTINRGIYLLAVLDDPSTSSSLPRWQPGPRWNKKLIVGFNGSAGAAYNQGKSSALDFLQNAGIPLSRGYAYMASTELWNQQHANPHVQGETLMMLKEHMIKVFGQVPRWTAGFGGSGGAIQQYLIAQLYPGLLDGIQALVSFPESFMAEVAECRLLQNTYTVARPTIGQVIDSLPPELQSQVPKNVPRDMKLRVYAWPDAKRQAVEGFQSNVCGAWDATYAGMFDSSYATSCLGSSPNPPSYTIFDRNLHPDGVRCDIFQTNANLLGKLNAKARRPFDNVGVQYGLDALNKKLITIEEFLDLNAKVGGLDEDGAPQAARSVADPDALRQTYAGGLKNSFSGWGLSSIPIITSRNNSDALTLAASTDPTSGVLLQAYKLAGVDASNWRMDIHEPMQDLVIRERLKAANGGRADNQIIWSMPSSVPLADLVQRSFDLMERWLDAISTDPAPRSMDKVARLKPADAVDACWAPDGTRIDEVASDSPGTQCNKLYPRASTPRLAAGAKLGNNVVKCALKPIDLLDYQVSFSGDEMARLKAIFPDGVCDWSQPGQGAVPLRGTYLTLPLSGAN